MSTSKIVKVRLHETKKGLGLIISSIDTDANGEEVNNPGAIHKALIHKNLKGGIDALAIHFAIMSGYIKPNQVEDIAAPDPELSESFIVKGYTLGGDEDEGTAGVILSGRKILPNGLAHNFNTPFYKFDLAPQARYAFMDDLIAKLTYLEQRIIAYKDGTERGEPIQRELDLKPGEKVTDEGNAVSEKDKHKYADKDAMARVADGDDGKKKGKKKVQQSAAAPSGEVTE